MPPTPPPTRCVRHKSMDFGARHSEGRWAREAWQGHLIATHLTPQSTASVRPDGDLDLLGAKGVRPYDRRMIVNARTRRISLLDRGSGWWDGQGNGSFFSFLKGVMCPCGGGVQSFRHLTRFCSLARVVECRGRVVEAMEAVDDSGQHDQWLHTMQELGRPGRNVSTTID